MLDELILFEALRQRPREGIEVDDDEIDGRDVELFHLAEVGRLGSVRKDAAVDQGVERLDPAPEHLRCAGDLLHWGHREAFGF